MTTLESFAIRVLEILETEPEWSSGTLDDISGAAYDLGLATNDPDDDCFTAILPPDRTSPAPVHCTVEVTGGVAEVTACPKHVTIEIIDHDNAQAG